MSKNKLKYQFAASAGLCNRLRGLASILRKDVPFTVFQPKSDLFPGRLQDILDNPIEDHFEREGRLATWKLTVSPEESKHPVDLMYHLIPENVKALLLPSIYRLQFKDSLKSEMQFDYAVHIREAKDWTVAGRQTPLESYFEEIDKLNPAQFFVIVHTREVEDAVRDRYGDRAIFHPTRRHGATDVEGLRQWARELLVLSKSKHIVGHCLSTFMDTAWWLGGCEAQVHRVGKIKTK